MEMIIDFPGGARVDAYFGTFTVATDQPPLASAPSPLEVFLSSIGTCAGIYVLGFANSVACLRKASASSSGSITTPSPTWSRRSAWKSRFRWHSPKKYRDSLIRSAELCAVKKHIEKPPRFDITTKVVAGLA